MRERTPQKRSKQVSKSGSFHLVQNSSSYWFSKEVIFKTNNQRSCIEYLWTQNVTHLSQVSLVFWRIWGDMLEPSQWTWQSWEQQPDDTIQVSSAKKTNANDVISKLCLWHSQLSCEGGWLFIAPFLPPKSRRQPWLPFSKHQAWENPMTAKHSGCWTYLYMLVTGKLQYSSLAKAPY